MTGGSAPPPSSRPRSRRVVAAHDLADDERSTVSPPRHAPVLLAYPSPYRVGMSSLGFQTLYRILNEQGPGAHRAFLPDPLEAMAQPWPPPLGGIASLERGSPASAYRVVAFSVAYELEVVGLVRFLRAAGLPILARDRTPHDPIVVAGGPLTTTNASLVLPFVDLLIAGEGEDELPRVLEHLLAEGSRSRRIHAALGPHTVPGHTHEDAPVVLPTPARACASQLPARSAITTPHTELSNMYLIEPERGCSRQCTFCVMRGETTGGMRIFDIDRVLELIPPHALRVGLVGAAVTDHPRREELVERIVDSGRGVGLSSLRADRLTPSFLELLKRGGYRTITVASDGISERLRAQLERRIHADDLRNAAAMIRAQGFYRMKLYQMIGAPTETMSDVDELGAFALELAKTVRLSLTISTFVAKRNTPLDGEPFVGIDEASRRLDRLRAAVKGQVDLRPQPPRWAFVEYELAQRSVDGGYAALRAIENGGSFRAFERALRDTPREHRPLVYGNEAARARRRGKAALRGTLPVL